MARGADGLFDLPFAGNWKVMTLFSKSPRMRPFPVAAPRHALAPRPLAAYRVRQSSQASSAGVSSGRAPEGVVCVRGAQAGEPRRARGGAQAANAVPCAARPLACTRGHQPGSPSGLAHTPLAWQLCTETEPDRQIEEQDDPARYRMRFLQEEDDLWWKSNAKSSEPRRAEHDELIFRSRPAAWSKASTA